MAKRSPPTTPMPQLVAFRLERAEEIPGAAGEGVCGWVRWGWNRQLGGISFGNLVFDKLGKGPLIQVIGRNQRTFLFGGDGGGKWTGIMGCRKNAQSFSEFRLN